MIEHSDEVVERILAGLRFVQPDAGMERRILATLDARASSRSRSGWLHLHPMAATSFACAIIAVAVFTFSITHHHPAHKSTHVKAPQFTSDAQADTAQDQSQPGRFTSAEKNTHRTAEHSAKLIPAIKSEASRESATVSFPTPPLPLTEQEKLLLQLANHRSSKLPLLDSKAQAAKEAKQFDDFFTPEPSVVVNESPAL